MRPSPFCTRRSARRSTRCSTGPWAAVVATCLAVAAALAAAPGAAAASLAPSSFGPRLGLGDDPDQVVVGFVVDYGDLTPRLRLQPSLDLALGEDDFSAVSLLVPVHYRFPAVGAFNPYAGGGIQLSYLDYGDPQGRGRGHGDGTDFDIAPMGVAGVDFPMNRNAAGLERMALELELGGGDAADVRLMFALVF
jgi:hypothetical protein